MWSLSNISLIVRIFINYFTIRQITLFQIITNLMMYDKMSFSIHTSFFLTSFYCCAVGGFIRRKMKKYPTLHKHTFVFVDATLTQLSSSL